MIRMLKIEKILVPVDFSVHSRDALKAALALKRDFGAELILLHVFDISQLLGLGWTVYGESLEGEVMLRMEKDSQKALDDFAGEMQVGSDTARLVVARGKPFIEVVRVARAENVDMVAMGTHGRKGIELLVLGSNAEKVVRKAPCSVMTLRHDDKRPPKPFPAKKILVPTDFSLTSERAMSMAVRIASKYSAEIILLHVFSDFNVEEAVHWTSYISTDKTEAELEEKIFKRANEELDVFIGKFPLGDLKVRPVVLNDKPHDGIVDLAEDEKVDLIVMGTHGRTGVSHLLLGSTAEKVVRSAACPVLTVKPRNYVFEMP